MNSLHRHALRVRVALCLALTLLSVAASASAAGLELTPAVQTGFELKFGGSRALPHQASLRFAAGYALPMRGAEITFDERPDRIALEQTLVPMIDASFSEQRATNVIHVAGFRLQHADADVRADYSDDTPSWWGRNWWWVALAGAAAVAGAALAGSSHGDSNNNPGPSPSGCQQPNGVSGDVIGPQPLTVDCTPVPGT